MKRSFKFHVEEDLSRQVSQYQEERPYSNACGYCESYREISLAPLEDEARTRTAAGIVCISHFRGKGSELAFRLSTQQQIHGYNRDASLLHHHYGMGVRFRQEGEIFVCL